VGNLWAKENLRAVITFYDGSTYVAETTGSLNIIRSASFIWRLGNDSSNPLGITSASSVTLELWDANDYLSPTNTKSPYYDKLDFGVTIELFKADKGSSDWKPYGTFYASGIVGSYDGGSHDVVQLSADDALVTIGDTDAPGVQVYGNIQVGELLSAVFDKLTPSYTLNIDPSIASKTISIGAFKGSKVRDIINTVCQATLSRCFIDRNGDVCISPAITPYTYGNSWAFGAGDLGTLSNEINSASNINKIEVIFYEVDGKTTETQQVFSRTQDLVQGSNTITADFIDQVLSIDGVKVLSDYTKGSSVQQIQVQAYNKGAQLIVTTSAPISGAVIEVLGSVLAGDSTTVSQVIAERLGGQTFTYQSQQLISSDDAEAFLQSFVTYIKTISKRIAINGSVITPDVFIGDSMTISNTGTSYDGNYIMSEVDIQFGENYSCSIKAVKVNG
jgi:hypothetical protein